MVSLGFVSSLRFASVAVGVAFVVFGLFVAGNYVFRMNVDRNWGSSMLLYDLGFVMFGVALELFGVGLIVLGKRLGE